MVAHLFLIIAITLVILVCRFLAYLPGSYDRLAVTLAHMAQMFGATALLLVPIGVVWLIYELRHRRETDRPSTRKSHFFAIASLVVSSLVAASVAVAALIQSGWSLAVGVIALWIYSVARMTRRVKALKDRQVGGVNPAPLYLLVVPTVVALVHWWLVGPATEFSRNYAIQQSVPLINDIEAYHRANGRYPISLHALWSDYDPLVIGIERFYYEPNGEAYNLYFEQLAIPLGTNEIVMYNPRDEHHFGSHDADILKWTPEQVRTRRTYYAVHDASTPHWKYFWFD